MISDDDLGEISPKPATSAFSADHVIAGLPIPKAARIELFSADEWEQFVEEWASSLKTKYPCVKRFSGAGDKGIDIAGFLKESGKFEDGWDNYQCKHYDRALAPSDIWVEIGKVVYYTWLGEYPRPLKYFFVAPKGVGTSASRLLSNHQRLKTEFMAKWDAACRNKISDTGPIDLTGALLAHAKSFKYEIFGSLSVVRLIEGHAKTTFHAVRFGGGLPARGDVAPPPHEIHPNESRYVEQLYGVYSEATGAAVGSVADLASYPDMRDDFTRQRERFYHAESLRNFARDNVPEGTYEHLKEDAYQGVIDTCNAHHPNGLTRMRETLNRALQLYFGSSPLVTVMRNPDKQGICHQLANEDRLRWIKGK